MIIYKANDKGLVTEVCIMNVKRFVFLEAAQQPYHEIKHYHTVKVNYNGHFFTILIPFDNHFHKLNNELVTVENMKHFNNCYNVNERIPICLI